jgi:trehalose 2-sulfotransferase
LSDLSKYAHWVLEAPLPAEPTTPTSSYLICSGQRSGTWLLSGLLDSTGVAGHPHEYFEAGTERANRERWGVDSLDAYLACVRSVGTTSNGVFAASVMWPNFSSLLDRLSASGQSLEAFPQRRFVFLWREDVVAQAVSWSRAAQTGYYHHWDSPAAKPGFDPEQIDALVHEASANVQSWRGWFAEVGVEPLAIRFEDLVADKETTVRRVLSFLDLDLPDGVEIAERTVVASDDESRVWAEKYCRLRSKGAWFG